ncbi:MAG: transposase [Patescibacteria group bacterium]|nr:transposase [Patescibacteria group bacterium]
MKIPDEYYHVYNRGVLKNQIFRDQQDWVRFLFSILHFQSDLTLTNLTRPVSYFVRHSMFNTSQETIKEIVQQRKVSLVAFSLMPNHFHLLLKNHVDEGIFRYMQRLLNSHTKYFNNKYQQSGHLFQGRYKSVHIEDNDQLLHLSAYIHKHTGGWNSRNDYLKSNRWPCLLTPSIVTDQFNDKDEYKSFLASSVAKKKAEEIEEELDINRC